MSYDEEEVEDNPYAAPRTDIRGRRGGWGMETVVYAGFWLRVVASIVDGFVTGGIGLVLGFAMGIIIAMMPENSRAGLLALTQLIAIVIGIVYFAGMESSASQATLGKMAVGIKVTDLNGERISFLNAVGRYLGKFVSAIILGIGFIMAGFTERKQALHDMMAGTLVVKSR